MSSMAERTLWLGELETWMTEDWLRQLFMSVGEQVTVKSIRDKTTGLPANYCFLEFGSSQGASKSLAALNGTVVPGTNKALRMNWSAGGGPGMPGSRSMGGTASGVGGGGEGEFSMFVGDLAYDVTDAVLLQLFQSRYNSVRSARIVTDANTGANKGYGFVKFSDESDQRRAMMEMQGVMCGNRPIRVSQATPKHRQTYSIQLAKPTIAATNVVPQAYAGYAEPDANVYIGNITPTTTDEDIRQCVFSCVS